MKLKHRLKLLWLRRKWVIQSVYNNKEFKWAKYFLELEKEIKDLYHKAKREGNKIEISKAKGRIEFIKEIKKELNNA